MLAALDSYANKQLGENSHPEYSMETGTSIDKLKERIVQFSFQLVRTNSGTIHNLSVLFTKLLLNVYLSGDKTLLSVLYCLTGQLRDIESGKGERNLSYMMVYVWYQFVPELAINLLKRFVKGEETSLPFGSHSRSSTPVP